MFSTTNIYLRLTDEAGRVEELINKLTQENEPLSILNDEPTEQSYSVTKVVAACKVLFQNSWALEERREEAHQTYNCSVEHIIDRDNFLLSFQSEEEINTALIEKAKLEVEAFRGVKALSSRAELIRTILSSEREEEIGQSAVELIRDQDIPSLDRETVEAILKKIMDREFNDYPELFAIAMDNRTSNTLARQMIETMISYQIVAIRSEKNRISRVKQAVQKCLAGLQESVVKHWETLALLVEGRTQVIQVQELQDFTYEIFMENQELKKSVKIDLMPSIVQ